MFRFFYFKQKTAYEMRISDWSSDVCSSDLAREFDPAADDDRDAFLAVGQDELERPADLAALRGVEARRERVEKDRGRDRADETAALPIARRRFDGVAAQAGRAGEIIRSEERRVGKEGVRTCSTRGSP